MDNTLVDILKEYISVENACFVPLLVFVGKFLKVSTRFHDTTIPSILAIVGVLLCGLVSFSENRPESIINWVLLVSVSIGQGISVAGVSVFFNQWIKQNKKWLEANNFDGA